MDELKPTTCDEPRRVATEKPRCGARCRQSGLPCRKWRVVNERTGRATRCALHGGRSTGPRTEEGKRTVGEAMRKRAFKNGLYTREAIAARAALRAELADLRARVKNLTASEAG